tara:strand:- start:697 stop:1278 length:582 start_codon:yes stop_codon:yes gene_type:complete
MVLDVVKSEDEDQIPPNINCRFEDGEWWYYGNKDGTRRRLKGHRKKYLERMYVNGKYIPKSNPLWKAGRYKSFDDAWSHKQINSTTEGEVYIIVNDAWPEWVKVGKAVSSEDRCNGYQTSSPFRDYSVIATLATDNRHIKEKEMHRIFYHFADERRGEWFKIDRVKAIRLFNVHAKNKLSEELENEKANATGS